MKPTPQLKTCTSTSRTSLISVANLPRELCLSTHVARVSYRPFSIVCIWQYVWVGEVSLSASGYAVSRLIRKGCTLNVSKEWQILSDDGKHHQGTHLWNHKSATFLYQWEAVFLPIFWIIDHSTVSRMSKLPGLLANHPLLPIFPFLLVHLFSRGVGSRLVKQFCTSFPQGNYLYTYA